MAIRLDTELLKAKTLELLGDVGIKVEHDELTAIMIERGCTVAPSGRIRIPKGLIDDFTAYQDLSRAKDDDDQTLVPICGPDWTHWLMWTGQRDEVRERLKTEFMMQAFDCGPTQYADYRSGELIAVNTDIFIEMMKLAESTPEIGYISTWYRQDVPPATERIASLILGMQYTTKVDGIEAIDPACTKYLVEIGEIISGNPGDARFLAGSQCLISPLILDHRAAEDMMDRHRLGVVKFHAASMPTIGISTPVTVAGGIVLGAAEILGCLAAAFCLNPEGDLTWRMISTVMDMRTADAASAGPENVAVIAGVKTLFDAHFGGHLWSETYFSPSTCRPGLQAVYQNFYGATAFGRLMDNAGINYPGMGTLDNGGVGSPEQFMLDMEIRKSQHALVEEIEVSEDTLIFDEIRERVDTEETFLMSDHTVANFRKLWTSDLFPMTLPETLGDLSDEKRILDLCEEKWRANVEGYQQPELAPDLLKELEGVLARATEELR